ncbi:Chloramphenicol acetyltransferase [compost metagenome]|jgi:acetyltransferase-like isoleucine patch superfamily enzyme|nr:CatB-related O-acetyltransferase [Pseudomonas sp. S11A 273]
MIEWIALALSLCSLLIVIFYVKWGNPNARNRRRKARLKQVPEFDRGAYVFKKKYPQYAYGTGTYGLPTVKDFGDGTTLKIGAYSSIASGVLIVLGGHHRTDWVTTYPFPAKLSEAAHISDYGGSRGDVIIGNDVWLCSQCTILSGVTVGTGAVVAASTVVTRDVAPYSIVAGNPARVVGWRFDERVRAELLASQWWEWPKEEVTQVVGLLCNDNIENFLAYARKRNAVPATA